MKGLAELVVSLCDLCEAEGRLLEAGILRTVRRAALLSLGLLFGAAALALLLAALYALLTALLPRPAALALLGGASAGIAGILLWSARGGAAPDAGEQKQPTGTGTGETGPAPTAPEPAAPGAPKPAPKPAQEPAGTTAQSHDPWAEVTPYGHSPGADGRPEPGKRPSPQGAGRMQER